MCVNFERNNKSLHSKTILSEVRFTQEIVVMGLKY